jgi:hypothetical protein
MHRESDGLRSAGRPQASIAVVAGLSLAVLVVAGVTIYMLAAEREPTTEATTTAGFKPIIDQVRPVPAPATVGQGGGAAR